MPLRKYMPRLMLHLRDRAAEPHGPHAWKEKPPKDEQDRRDSRRVYEIEMEFIHRWESNLKHADPLSRVIELPGAHHYMFQNEETDVLHHIKTFLQDLN